MDGLGDHFFVHEKFILQRGYEWLDMLAAYFGDDVGTLRGAHHAVKRTGERAANEIWDAKFFENTRYFNRDRNGFGQHR